ncbi:hypothetical protein F2Q69_00028021 [Brassica cretica]|uniref:Uncharacterized protein n=1 Tax=Brassica cretica TaxID=69181 RepID=A0A8S9RVU9_BRACR|nr:hypothetical protein F2Q69_00028021 [Brassica cretica]
MLPNVRVYQCSPEDKRQGWWTELLVNYGAFTSMPLVTQVPSIIVGMDVPSVDAIVSSIQWPLVSKYRACFSSHGFHLPLILRSRFGYAGFSDLEDFWARRLPGSLPDDFQEVFQTTSRKSFRRLPGSLLT